MESHPRRIAPGLSLYLGRFAAEHSAETWKQIVDHPHQWWPAFLELLADEHVLFAFNLTSVDVVRGVLRAASGLPGRSMTDRELLEIELRPEIWSRIE